MDGLSLLGGLFIVVFVATVAICLAVLIVWLVATGISDLADMLITRYHIWRNTRRWE